MTSSFVLLALLWTAVIAAEGWIRRPVPRLVDRLHPQLRAEREGTGGPHVFVAVARACGHPVRRAFGRRDDPAADAAVGGALLLGAASAVVSPVLGAVVAAGAVALPIARRRSTARARVESVAAALPDVADLFVLVVGSGLNARLALDALASRAPPAWRSSLQGATARVAAGQPLADALAHVGYELGDPAWPLTNALRAAERDGTPLLPALQRIAVDARADRRRQNESAARRLPVKLLFPLVVCIFPAFALLTVAPLLAGALRSLRL